MAEVLVQSNNTNNFIHDITLGAHKLTADIDTELGGKDKGPNPHELMLAALGACTSMTIKVYAGRKGWDVQEVNVKLKDEQIVDPENPSRKLPKITRTIRVSGNLTQEQLDTLKAIADKCPIHKLLTDSKQIETELNAG